jgi:hypothetical protein
MIVPGKGKKKYYSDNGEEINDSDLFDKHVTYYHEEVPKMKISDINIDKTKLEQLHKLNKGQYRVQDKYV